MLETIMKMLEKAENERAENKTLIETKVGGLEVKVDTVVGTVKELASKAESHEATLAAMQAKVSTMEMEIQDLKKGKETPSYKEVASGEVVVPVPVPAVPAVPAAAAAAAAASGVRRPAGQEERIKEMFLEANSTLTFSPIAEEDWKQLTTHLVEEEKMDPRMAEKVAGHRMVEEFLNQEMLMKEEHIKEVMSQVETLWPKVKTNWNTLVVRFANETIAEWILRGKGKMRRGVEGINKPVVDNWVPGGLYKRYNALRSVAYRLRQTGLKTRINFGMSDFSLVTKKDKRDSWSAPVSLETENLPSFQLSDLPAVLTREQRSPTLAPGRARYGGTAPRQGKRLRVASPGLSPSGKEPRVEGEAGNTTDEEEEVEGSEIERGTRGQDKNVTARRSKQKA